MKTLYVSTQGDDRWSGALAEPAAGEGPFATLERARDEVRRLRATGLAEPVTVLVRGGRYLLAAPLVFDARDSGSREAPLSFAAYPGELPVLSGGSLVTGWQTHAGPIRKAALPHSQGGRWPCRQLFCRGRRLRRARWPKLDPADPLYSGWALTEGAAQEGSTTSFVYRPGTFRRRWAKPTQVEMVYWAWIGGWGSRVPVAAHDPEHRTITLAHAGWQFDVPGWFMPVPFTADNRFYAENALEDLTEPGEWCFDSEEGLLYFWPPDPGAEQEVVAPRLATLVELLGVSWVGFSGLTFTETGDGDNFHREGVEGAGAMYPRPGWRYCGEAVRLKDAEHCAIENCHFDQVGGNAVYLEGHNSRNRIRGNHIAGAGANGVTLIGTRLKHPRFNEVSHNYIHHCGVFNKYTAGIFAGMSDGNQLNHNQIEHLPHHAINLGNNPWGRNFVEYNQIRWVDEEVADSTAINCWMEDPPEPGVQRCGHLIRFNYIADIYGCEVSEGHVGRSQRMPTSGIYLDNYSSNCTVYGNLILRCTHAGILVHAGKNNLIENNLLIDCPEGIRFQDYVSGMEYWQPMRGFMTGNRVRRNLCCHLSGGGLLLALHAWTDRVLAESDHNLLFDAEGGNAAIRHLDQGRTLSLGEWQDQGYDVHSVATDPLFVDAAAGDYRLRPESPALALGFAPLPFPAILSK
ncbi:MAG: right-handed parallel beta-helix repeat-containing protein [Candidatus Latescibacteria bacterium]|nr:right-handed parallel beta-helix repeat-containing protein [Candidatus Latescibacterota bacterium]